MGEEARKDGHWTELEWVVNRGRSEDEGRYSDEDGKDETVITDGKDRG